MIKPFVTTFCNAVAAAYHTHLDNPDQCRAGAIFYTITESDDVMCGFMHDSSNEKVTRLLKGSFLAEIFEAQMAFNCTNQIPEACTYLITKLPRLLRESDEQRPLKIQALENELHRAALSGILEAIRANDVIRN